jgi:lipopolysaccharide transport system ATP-binding protein
MYVRLAFAVAAHLDPDILIVDEVLAVGDAEFQKKCIGKMKSVSTNEGRTVLFVSHNMVSVNTLCSTGLYLRNGEIALAGSIKEVITKYMSQENAIVTERNWKETNLPGDDEAVLLAARLIDEHFNTLDVVEISQKIGILYEYEVLRSGNARIPNVHVYNSKGECVFVSTEKENERLSIAGKVQALVWIPGNLLNDGTYIVGIALTTITPLKVHFFEQNALVFDVVEDINARGHQYNQAIPGVIRPSLEWQTNLV